LRIKSVIKRYLLGRPRLRPREISRGLLKGLKFNVDTSNKSMRLLGLDESEIASVTRRLAAEAKSAADVGANDGWYSLYFASRPNITRVFAFEPGEMVMEAMHKNFELNDPAFLAKTTLVTAFVGNKVGQSGLVRLDDYVSQFPEPILLKIDVDGGEIDVLEGGQEMLSRDCRLIVETHSEQLEKGCIQRLEGMGYSCRIIHNAWYRALIPEARPIPHNRWFIAERRKS
jgi:Methyltransferase FkbM domain